MGIRHCCAQRNCVSPVCHSLRFICCHRGDLRGTTVCYVTHLTRAGASCRRRQTGCHHGIRDFHRRRRDRCDAARSGLAGATCQSNIGIVAFPVHHHSRNDVLIGIFHGRAPGHRLGAIRRRLRFIRCHAAQRRGADIGNQVNRLCFAAGTRSRRDHRCLRFCTAELRCRHTLAVSHSRYRREAAVTVIAAPVNRNARYCVAVSIQHGCRQINRVFTRDH